MKFQPQLFFRLFAMVVLLALGVSAQPAAAQAKPKAEWLPLCGKCLMPSIFSESGIGTAHAVAKARVTYQDAKDHCENWAMSDHPDCDKQAKETLKEENGKIYTATADCVHGKLTAATGDSFTYAGIWPSSFKYLAGKTRWRWGPGPDEGTIVSIDGPEGAAMIDATSKIVCPNGIGARR